MDMDQIVTETAAKAPEPAEIDRIVKLSKHEEIILNQRVSIFLVAEAIMLLFTGNMIAISEDFKLLAVSAGLAITFCWILTGVRQSLDLSYAKKAMVEVYPDIEVIFKGIPGWLKRATLFLLVYFLPLVFVALWTSFLFISPVSGGAS